MKKFFLKLKSDKGFTLVEVLTVMLILGLVISVFGSFFTTGFKTWGLMENRGELQQNLRFAMDKITNDVRNAPGDTVTVQAANPILTVWANVYQYEVDSNGVLRRKAYQVDSNGVHVLLNNEPVTTDNMTVVGFYVYKKQIEAQDIYTVILEGKMGNSGYLLQSKVSPRSR